MTWLLRRATPDDLDAIMALEHDTFPTDAWSAATMRTELANPAAYYLVAVPDGGSGIEGYAGLLCPPGAEDADVQTLAVAVSARRRGLGRTLLRALVAESVRRGARRLFLEVRADNPAAQELYRSEGFEEIGIRKRYYQPDDVDAVVMRRSSTPPRIVTATAEDQP